MNTNIFPRMHVSLYVSDMDRTVNFYNKFFGLQPVKIKPGYAKYILEKPSLIISFVQNEERVNENFGHLGFQVESIEELQSRKAEAESKSIQTLEGKGTNCCYAIQDKFWVSDPDGVRWEVYYFHADSEFRDIDIKSDEMKACCA